MASRVVAARGSNEKRPVIPGMVFIRDAYSALVKVATPHWRRRAMAMLATCCMSEDGRLADAEPIERLVHWKHFSTGLGRICNDSLEKRRRAAVGRMGITYIVG